MAESIKAKELLPEIWRRRIIVALFLLFAFFILYKLGDVLVPFVLAWIAAYLVTPVVTFLEKHTRLEREGAANAVIIVLVIFTLLGILLTVPVIIDQTRTLFRQIPEYGAKLQTKIDEFQVRGTIPPEAREIFHDGLERAKESVPSIAQYAGGMLIDWLSSFVGLVSLVFSTITFVFVFYFFLRDFPKINRNMIQAMPERYRARSKEILTEMDVNLKAVLRGQLLVALALCVLYSIGLAIAGVPYAFIIGIVAGFGNFLPYIGPMLGLLPAVLFVLLEQGFEVGAAMNPLLGIAVVFGVVQFLEGFILTPRFAGGSLGLGPVTTLFAISAGGVLLGLVGIVAALPAAAIVKVILKRFWAAYTSSDFYAKPAADPSP